MTQDFDSPLANDAMSEVRKDLNAIHETLRSKFSGASAPTSPTPVQGQPWWDTNTKHDRVFDGSGWLWAGGLDPVVSPAQITAQQDDYAAAVGYRLARLNSDAAQAITGFVAPAATEGFPALVLVNVGSQSIQINDQDASSAEENRIITTTGGNQIMLANGSYIMLYDNTSDRWRALNFVSGA